MTWIQTYTGKKVFPLSLRASDVEIEDIAHSLALTCRFNGHCEVFYSVAQHSVVASFEVEPLVPESIRATVALDVLMHDAHEAYLPDIPSPISGCFSVCRTDHPEVVTLKRMKERVQSSIAAGLECGMESEICKKVDRRMLATEARDVMKKSAHEWESLAHVTPFANTILPWPWEEAKQRFLERYETLRREVFMDREGLGLEDMEASRPYV